MKINRIQISNYRAFLVDSDQESSRYIIELPNGENLLIYGENGSGKSSLFKALREFFVSAADSDQPFNKNLFYKEENNSEQPFVCISLQDGSELFFSAEAARTNTHLASIIAEANITKGFISYRDLLKLHFKQNSDEPDLFSFFLGESGLFAEMVIPSPLQPANKISYKALWTKIHEHLDSTALVDYNTNASSQFQELEARANMLMSFFHKDCTLKINFTDGEIEGQSVKLPSVSFDITLFGKRIPSHSDVLNEARLTSLAVSVYLAHILSLPVTTLRILFLDDIFIGLDMSNRIPLIRILTADDLGDGTSFRDFQIFVTTYDREWFNVAKTYLTNGWQKIEFYVDNHSQDVDRPYIRRSGTYIERAEFHFLHGDYPACANYLRKAFENALRNILPENNLYVGKNTTSVENNIVMVAKNHLTVKETEDMWVFVPKSSSDTQSSSYRSVNLHTLIDLFKSLITQYEIPFPYSDELLRIKNRLLNPLSHDDLKSSIFKADLEAGFLILRELLTIKSKILVDISNNSPAFLFFDYLDYEGKDYAYKFQLLENLRYIEYKGVSKVLKAECKPVSRTLKPNGKEELSDNKSQKSVYDLCRGICIYSAPKGNKKNVVLDESVLLNQVYTEEGKTLRELV